MEQQISHFSLISRLFGNLFCRSPNDPVVQTVFSWLQQQSLTPLWALEMDKETERDLASVQMPLDLDLLNEEYQRLFVGEQAKVSPKLTAYGIELAEFVAFRQERTAPESDNVDHFALALLTASWLDDHVDSTEAQRILFEQFLLPCASQFLAQVEKQASLPFYRALARLTRELLAAMADELDEQSVN